MILCKQSFLGQNFKIIWHASIHLDEFFYGDIWRCGAPRGKLGTGEDLTMPTHTLLTWFSSYLCPGAPVSHRASLQYGCRHVQGRSSWRYKELWGGRKGGQAWVRKQAPSRAATVLDTSGSVISWWGFFHSEWWGAVNYCDINGYWGGNNLQEYQFNQG